MTDAYSQRWPKNRRGPYETADGVRYVVHPNRLDDSVPCVLCGYRVLPGQLVATVVAGQSLCLDCQPEGASRIRAGRKSPKTGAPSFRAFVLEHGATLWTFAPGDARVYAPNRPPPDMVLGVDDPYCIGRLKRSSSGWNGNIVASTTVGSVDLLIPIHIDGMQKLSLIPGSAYLRFAETDLLKVRLKDPVGFRRMQWGAHLRLLAWNKQNSVQKGGEREVRMHYP